MDTTFVRCNHCGAPLEVAFGIRFVTCQFCDCSLEVKRNESTIFTEEIEKIADNTEMIVEKLDRIERHQKQERNQWRARGKDEGNPTSAGERVLGGIAGAIFMLMFTAGGIFFAVESQRDGAREFFGLVGAGFALIGVIGFFSMLVKAFSSGSGSEE